MASQSEFAHISPTEDSLRHEFTACYRRVAHFG